MPSSRSTARSGHGAVIRWREVTVPPLHSSGSECEDYSRRRGHEDYSKRCRRGASSRHKHRSRQRQEMEEVAATHHHRVAGRDRHDHSHHRQHRRSRKHRHRHEPDSYTSSRLARRAKVEESEEKTKILLPSNEALDKLKKQYARSSSIRALRDPTRAAEVFKDRMKARLFGRVLPI